MTVQPCNPHWHQQKKATVIVEAEASAFISLCNSPADLSPTGLLPGELPLRKSPSISSDVVAEVMVEAGVIACHVCSSLARRSNKPDDTDSFTPRVRSDKRSITILLGKGPGFESPLPVCPSRNKKKIRFLLRCYSFEHGLPSNTFCMLFLLFL